MNRFRLHIIKPSQEGGWLTGRGAAGERVLAGVVGQTGVRLRFDEVGGLVDTETEELAGPAAGDWAAVGIAVEKPIRVREFSLEGLPVAVFHLPLEFTQFEAHPDEFNPAQRAQLAVQIHEWRERHRYVFHWGREYWCDEEGHLTGWRPITADPALERAV